jgi:hypothetical protein
MMKKLTNDDKLFCETFVKTFDFHNSCITSSSNRAEMAVRLADETDGVNVFIRNSIDSRKIANKFLTSDLVVNELIKIVLSGDPKYVLQSSKMLLGLENGGDGTEAFQKLLTALQK